MSNKITTPEAGELEAANAAVTVARRRVEQIDRQIQDDAAEIEEQRAEVTRCAVEGLPLPVVRQSRDAELRVAKELATQRLRTLEARAAEIERTAAEVEAAGLKRAAAERTSKRKAEFQKAITPQIKALRETIAKYAVEGALDELELDGLSFRRVAAVAPSNVRKPITDIAERMRRHRAGMVGDDKNTKLTFDPGAEGVTSAVLMLEVARERVPACAAGVLTAEQLEARDVELMRVADERHEQKMADFKSQREIEIHKWADQKVAPYNVSGKSSKELV